MADIAFNTTAGQTINRELLIAYLNTGTSVSPTWSPIGKRVTDSAMEYDWSEDTIQDILGQTYTTMKLPVITQTFDPLDLDAGDVASVKIWNMAVKDLDTASLSAQDMLVVHFYAGSNFAERWSNCAVKPSSLGGEGGDVLSMPIDVTFGGTRTLGTATVSTSGVVTFTED